MKQKKEIGKKNFIEIQFTSRSFSFARFFHKCLIFDPKFSFDLLARRSISDNKIEGFKKNRMVSMFKFRQCCYRCWKQNFSSWLRNFTVNARKLRKASELLQRTILKLISQSKTFLAKIDLIVWFVFFNVKTRHSFIDSTAPDPTLSRNLLESHKSQQTSLIFFSRDRQQHWKLAPELQIPPSCSTLRLVPREDCEIMNAQRRRKSIGRRDDEKKKSPIKL